MQEKLTIRKIASLCGVSPATVSRVMSGKAPVNPETRRRIEESMERYGYIPKPSLRRKKPKQGNIIGVLLPSMDQDYFQRVLQEIDDLLQEQGRQLVVISEHLPGVLQIIENLSLLGLILLSEETGNDTVEHLKKKGLSMVMCGALSLTKSCPAVHVDDLAAAYDGTNYLLELGHRKIGFITDSPHSISSGFQRIAGSRKAMEDHGLSLLEHQMFSRGMSRVHDYSIGYEGAKELVSQNSGLTAIFAHSDALAIGAINALLDMGLSVPGDISVMGFDDTGSGMRCRPQLTCVHQPIRDIVAKSVMLLDEEWEGSGNGVPSITLPHNITVRGSCRTLR